MLQVQEYISFVCAISPLPCCKRKERIFDQKSLSTLMTLSCFLRFEARYFLYLNLQSSYTLLNQSSRLMKPFRLATSFDSLPCPLCSRRFTFESNDIQNEHGRLPAGRDGMFLQNDRLQFSPFCAFDMYYSSISTLISCINFVSILEPRLHTSQLFIRLRGILMIVQEY